MYKIMIEINTKSKNILTVFVSNQTLKFDSLLLINMACFCHVYYKIPLSYFCVLVDNLCIYAFSKWRIYLQSVVSHDSLYLCYKHSNIVWVNTYNFILHKSAQNVTKYSIYNIISLHSLIIKILPYKFYDSHQFLFINYI